MTLIAAVWLLLGPPLGAHSVIVEQLVDVQAALKSGQLTLQIHLPIGAILDAKLPLVPDGTLAPDAAPATLQVVAADTVRNLDVKQGDTTLKAQTVTVRPAADRTALDIVVVYPADGVQGLSARLNVFQGELLKPVRTTLTLQRDGVPPRSFSIAGSPQRVLVEPDAGDVVRRMLTLAASQVLTWSDPLLLLICLFLPGRRSGDAVRLTALVFAGQLVGLFATSLLGPLSPTASALAATLAASAVVVAALQIVVRARLRGTLVLAGGFGLLSGVALGGSALLPDLPFAGAHAALAGAVFAALVVAAEAWLAAIVWSTRAWLDSRGVPARGLALLGAVLVGHAAIHHVMDQGQAVTEAGSFAATHALMLIALGWTGVMLAIALVDLVSAPDATRQDALVSQTSHS
jgi:hypothetical protein